MEIGKDNCDKSENQKLISCVELICRLACMSWLSFFTKQMQVQYIDLIQGIGLGEALCLCLRLCKACSRWQMLGQKFDVLKVLKPAVDNIGHYTFAEVCDAK